MDDTIVTSWRHPDFIRLVELKCSNNQRKRIMKLFSDEFYLTGNAK
jgi:hypothetical protein